MPRKAGRGNPIITEEKVTDYLRQQDPPLAGTTQIAEQFDVARTSVIERLNTLQEKGVVGKVKVGQSFAWYLNEWGTVTKTSTSSGGPGGGSRPPERADKPETEPSAQTKTGDLPGILIMLGAMAVVGLVGFKLLGDVYQSIDGGPAKKTIWGGLTLGIASGLVGVGAAVVRTVAITALANPTIPTLIGSAVIAIALVALVYENGGVLGGSAKVSERAVNVPGRIAA